MKFFVNNFRNLFTHFTFMNFDTFLLHSIYFIMKESTHVLNSIFSERKGMFFPLFGCKSILADYFTYEGGF